MGKAVQVTLPDDLDAEVKAAVTRGDFANENEAITAAVDEWRANRMIEGIGVERLRKLWDEGIASGPGEGLSIDEIKARVRAKLNGGSA